MLRRSFEWRLEGGAGGWGVEREAERREGTARKPRRTEVNKFDNFAQRKFGRMTDRLNFGDKLEILTEQEDGEEEGESDDHSPTLERQDSGLSIVSNFSEVDLDPFLHETGSKPEEDQVSPVALNNTASRQGR